jgi:hypothetical protein
VAGCPELGIDIAPVVSTTIIADISSRSTRVRFRGGIGVSQMSASRPT